MWGLVRPLRKWRHSGSVAYISVVVIRQGESMNNTVLPLSLAARHFGMAHTSLDRWRQLGKLTVRQAGRIVLVDIEIARKELEQVGYFERKNLRVPAPSATTPD